MNTEIYHIAVSDKLDCRNKKLVLTAAADFLQTVSTKDLTISQLKDTRDYLDKINNLQVSATEDSREFAEYFATTKSIKIKNNNSKWAIGYVFSTDLPKVFYFDLNSAKVDLLFEVLDTYILMNKMTKDIQKELAKDLKIIINKAEPHIAGCGQITKVVLK